MKSKFIKIAVPLFIIVIASILYLNKQYNTHYITYKGNIYGTYFSIVYHSHRKLNEAIDSIFSTIDEAVSYYNPESEIQSFNRKGFLLNPSKIFLSQLRDSKIYFLKTNGAYDPTITPLVEAWGFGLGARQKIDKTEIDSLLQLVSFEKNIFFNDSVVKAVRKNTKLNLTAIGEGYTIDQISYFLDRKGIQDYKVEIGGEVKCKGLNPEDDIWKIGIENPFFSMGKEKDRLLAIIQLKDAAISTSGSYRKFYVDSLGRRRPHIINPKTGYPVTHSLLSASIKCKSAEKADAMATACMVLGRRKSIRLIKEDPELEGFLIYDNGSKRLHVWKSENFLK